MTASSHSGTACPAALESPAAPGDRRFRLYSPEFAADPHAAFRAMREHHTSLVPVELAPGIPATLIIKHELALKVLHNPERFPADPSRWQVTVPSECPILPMMQARPNALRSDGFAHDRYRKPTTAALGAVDLHKLHAVVETIAAGLINNFCEKGEADLIAQYAYPLAFEVLNIMLGCPAAIAERVAAGMPKMFEAGEGAAAGAAMVANALGDLVALKRVDPGQDVTSVMLAHPVNLSDIEMIHQLVTLYAAGIEPQVHLIANCLRLMLTDDRFAGNLVAGSLHNRDALDEVLFTDPPLSNYCISYPRHPVLLDGVWLPADQPVLISIAACNADPAITHAAAEITTGTYNASHLAFSAGPHACPARRVAYLVAQDAIDQLLDALPEMRLAIAPTELRWRPGPFHRSLAALPVYFPSSPPLLYR
ncbi:cytochrome P450 [Nocardia goodfellowii]